MMMGTICVKCHKVCNVESWVLLSGRGLIWGKWRELGWVIEREKGQIGIFGIYLE
jgi:hypothetical protein